MKKAAPVLKQLAKLHLLQENSLILRRVSSVFVHLYGFKELLGAIT